MDYNTKSQHKIRRHKQSTLALPCHIEVESTRCMWRINTSARKPEKQRIHMSVTKTKKAEGCRYEEVYATISLYEVLLST